MPDGMEDPRTVLDVRTIEGPPFTEIMAALEGVADDGSLLLISGFEPEPLYGVLEERGFTHEATQVAADEWHVEIRDG